MTTARKKVFFNFNLFILMIMIGIFMYWKKETRDNFTKVNEQFTQNTNSSPNLSQSTSRTFIKK